jgi:hypothetical protein
VHLLMSLDEGRVYGLGKSGVGTQASASRQPTYAQGCGAITEMKRRMCLVLFDMNNRIVDTRSCKQTAQMRSGMWGLH